MGSCRVQRLAAAAHSSALVDADKGNLHPGFFRSLLLRVRWLAWRIRADWLPALLATLLISAAVLLATGLVDSHPTITSPQGSGNAASNQAKAIELAVKILVAVLAAGAAVVTLSRSLVLGSARAAQTYIELRTDPLGPVRLFQKLVRTVRRPLVVFVDDLDRCESKYVVELLEGIQTLFRSAPMTYVVAADRKWICSSFEKGYEEFGKTIGEPGRPLGYLFLDKIFQISAAAPQLSPEVRRAYWRGLLRSATTNAPTELEKTRKNAEREAAETVKNAYTQEELDDKISKVADDPVREQAMRAAAAKQITSTEAQRATEHRLQRFADLLEPNPRSMKRLVNAYGLHQATHFLEGRSVSPEALALWTIIALRWPLLSDLLAAHPQWVNDLANGKAPHNNKIPKTLKELFGNDEVRGVFAGDADGLSLSLDEEAVRQIVGRMGNAGAGQTMR